MTSKVCKKCKEVRLTSDFYTIKGNRDGLSGKCKACAKADVRLNYRTNIKHFKNYERSRAKLPHRVAACKVYIQTKDGKAAKARASFKYKTEYPLKYKAKNAVANAIRSGKLVRGSCEVCGASNNIEGHHDDYSKPLSVRWLCVTHHTQWHKVNKDACNEEN